ncbi:MAG: hypothetical protein ABIS50_26090 [Luteolibacter sp.]|uniref:hypothetical protein n=1 Tax=Luteolibacter sp. TaxID=1962973 RepID=UPI003263AC9E
MKTWLVIFAMIGSVHGAEKMERWIYLPANFQVGAEVERVDGLLVRAVAAGYTHALIQDSKFSRLATVTTEYRPNVEKVKATAKRLGIELVPAVFPVGYSNDILFHDPNLAEGLPVRDALFVVKDGVAGIVSDPPVSLPSTTSKEGWGFVDDTIVPDDGAMRSKPMTENARLMKKLKVSPFRQYHVSVEIRTEGLAGGKPEIKALGKDGRSLQWTNLAAKADQPWTRYDVTFNSLNNDELTLYLGVWGGHRGTLWWRDAGIGECGPVNLLRRDGKFLTIKSVGGKILVEEKDFEPVTNPLTGTTPWPGAFKPWHEPPVLRVKGMPDGEKLRVSYYHAHIIYDEQVCGCVEEPAFQMLLRNQAKEVADLWETKTHFMSHDEWRLLGWDPACVKSGKTPGKIAADNLRLCTDILRKQVAGGRILVWNDIFDPYHNAVKNYYLANGSFEGSWEGLTPGVEIMNWNFGKRDDSLPFFSKLGHPQLIAGFYDGDLSDVDAWLASAKNVKRMKGFMYTTWRQDYSKLEAVAEKLQMAGW